MPRGWAHAAPRARRLQRRPPHWISPRQQGRAGDHTGPGPDGHSEAARRSGMSVFGLGGFNTPRGTSISSGNSARPSGRFVRGGKGSSAGCPSRSSPAEASKTNALQAFRLRRACDGIFAQPVLMAPVHPVALEEGHSLWRKLPTDLKIRQPTLSARRFGKGAADRLGPADHQRATNGYRSNR
jgi:hypothetical protein